MTAFGTYWTGAASKFTNDTNWRGGDVAASIDLGGGRVLWLFGDTFIKVDGSPNRSGSAFINNSVALQSGAYDLSSDLMTFYWGTAAGAPFAFFQAGNEEFIEPPDGVQRPLDGAFWYWPISGIVLDGVLIVSLARIETNPAGTFLQSSTSGVDAAIIANPQDPPNLWVIQYVPLWSAQDGVRPGMSWLDGGDGYVYTMGSAHGTFVYVRFDRNEMKGGRLVKPQFLTTNGWMPTPTNAVSMLTYQAGTNGAEASISSRSNTTLLVQTPGFGNTSLYAWQSKPKSLFTVPPDKVYTPSSDPIAPEFNRTDIFTYAGKAHPEQTWAGKGPNDILMTYATGKLSGSSVNVDDTVYYPRPIQATVPLLAPTASVANYAPTASNPDTFNAQAQTAGGTLTLVGAGPFGLSALDAAVAEEVWVRSGVLQRV